MGELVYSLVGFLVAIAILVAVHEYGHFWVARVLGVKVLRFSIGFGKSIFTWRRENDPTEYTIGLIPLGGYVKMLDEREQEVAEEERAQAFNRQSLSVRSAVVFAGPLFNFLFAIFAIWLVFVAGSDDIAPVVGEVTEDSVAAQAGFRPGDRLVEVDGRAVKTWGQHQLYMLHQAMKGNRIAITVANEEHGSRDLSIDFAALDQRQITGQSVTAQIGLYPPAPPAIVTQVVAGSPAESADLRSGDLILSVDGKAVADNWFAMATEVSKKPGQPINFVVRRGDALLDFVITPDTVTAEGQTYGRIGLYLPERETMKLHFGPVEALWQSMDYNWRMTVITLRALGRMVTARMSVENLSGPITIAHIAGQTAASGIADFMKFLAIISISLGLLNLLPIPVLDGGHLMYFLYEAVVGREPSERAMLWGQQLGIAMIAMLMIVAFYNDIMRLWS